MGVALNPGDLPEVPEIEHALDVVDLVLVDPEPLDQVRTQHRVHPRPNLEPHDLAEAPAA